MYRRYYIPGQRNFVQSQDNFTLTRHIPAFQQPMPSMNKYSGALKDPMFRQNTDYHQTVPSVPGHEPYHPLQPKSRYALHDTTNLLHG